MVVPQVVSSIATVIMGLPKTLYDVQDWALELLRNNPDLEQVISNVLENATQDLQNWLTNVLLPSVNSLLLQISLGAVSYTHLDVYKRQPKALAHRLSSRRLIL